MARRQRGQEPSRAIEWFRRVFGRDPTPAEAEVAEAHYGADPRRRQTHRLPERRCDYCRRKVPYVPDADNPLTGECVAHECDSPTQQLDMNQILRALGDPPAGDADR